jgi:hypothetical protein
MRTVRAALRGAWQVILDDWGAYVTLNVLYYGLVLLAMGYAFANPGVQSTLLQAVQASLQPGGSLSAVASVYGSGSVIAAAAVTFGFNLVMGSIVELTLPSVIIPFFGIGMGLFRALLWGLILAPQGSLALLMIPHSITLVLEGQGYIIAMLGVYAIWRGLLWPAAYSAAGHLAGYAAGLRRCARLYVLVAAVLAVAAVYESTEVILMMTLGSGR